MKILITGSNGLLGQKLVTYLHKKGNDFLATSKGKNRNPDCPKEKYYSLDISVQSEITDLFDSYKPTHVIHTAAITNVDACELDPDLCYLVNVQATQFLVDASISHKAHFQLLSTDFIFDGLKGNYNEEDTPGPLSHYAHSKVNAEKILLNSDYLNWSIVRTIIVYGTGNNLSRTNVVCWAKDALSKGQEMRIIDDQFRAPTWADDLAWACVRICTLKKTGIFHISGPETMSIYEIVERVARHFSLSTNSLVRTDSSTLKQPAKRPPRTGFDLSKSKKELGYHPMTLEETLPFI
ncbi:MAG: SDR family oxidoreductase [Crocinitomicaceae bacterium]